MALEYLGADDNVNCGSAASLDNLKATGGLSISAWVKFTNTGGGDGIYNGRVATKTWDFFLNSSATKTDVVFEHSGSGTTLLRETENTVGLAVNTLYHLMVTWDGSLTATNIHIYINNAEPTYVLTTNGTGTLTDDSAISLIAGNNAASTRGLVATLEDLAIWSKIISSTERATLYGNGSPLKGTPRFISRDNLVLYLPLDDFANGVAATGTGTILDKSGVGNHGTPANGVQGKTNFLAYPSRPGTGTTLRPRIFSPGLAR